MLKPIPWKIELAGKTERLLAAALLGIFLVQGAAALLHMSATGDETHYLGMGRYLIKYQRWDLDDMLLQPPLSYCLHSLPLLALPIDDAGIFSIPQMDARGRSLMRSQPDDLVLILARIPILMLAAGLGWLVFAWSKQAYGSAGGLAALFLYAFHPVVIGNAAQITPDLCLAFFSTLTIYLFWRYRGRPDWAHSLAVGSALGLSLLSKYSAALLVAALILLTFLPRSARRLGGDTARYEWRLRHLPLIFAAALLVVNTAYLYRGTLHTLRGNAFRSGLFQSAERIPGIRSLPLPLPEPYVKGLDLQHSVVEDGFLCFLLGQKSERGWFHYYVVAFFLKTPVPFLLLLFLTAGKGRDRLQWIILVPLIIFPLYFSAVRLSRGVRYILPVYPLLCVWIGQLALHLKARQVRPAMQWGMLLLMAWYAVGSLRIAPHYLAYINEAGGGPGNGVNLLFESDFDWGQEMKGLSAYLREKKIDHIKFGYFSTADPAHYGIRHDPLPCETPAKAEAGLIAVSATALQVWGCYDWLKAYTPVDKVGYTIFIYDIPSRAIVAD